MTEIGRSLDVITQHPSPLWSKFQMVATQKNKNTKKSLELEAQQRKHQIPKLFGATQPI